MMYTAAFTGSPNGALLSNRALIVQGSLIAQIQGVGPDYVYLDCGPLFHVATFMTTLATFLVGGTNVFTPRVDAEELCRLIAEEHCTGGFIMPPTMDQIVELNADGRFDLKTLAGLPGQAGVDGHDHRGREPLGPASRRLRPDRGHGAGHLQRPAAQHRLERPPRALRAHRRARPRRQRARRRARWARSACAAPPS